jgi:hypothetical protein
MQVIVNNIVISTIQRFDAIFIFQRCIRFVSVKHSDTPATVGSISDRSTLCFGRKVCFRRDFSPG